MYYVHARARCRKNPSGGCEISLRENPKEKTREAVHPGDRGCFGRRGKLRNALESGRGGEIGKEKNERAKAAKNGDEEKEKERMEHDAPVDGARGARGVRQLFSLFTHDEGDGRREILGGRRVDAEFSWVPSTVVELLVAAVPK